MSQNLLVKYSLILTPQELKILHKDNIKNVDGIQTEQPKVLQKLMKSQLRPNERKKVVSKNTGKWLCMSDDFAHCTGFSFERWVEEVRLCPRTLKSRMSKFCKSPFANIVSQWADTPVLKRFSQPIVCYDCGKLSSSLQAHSVHLASAHGIKSKFRKFVDSSVCKVCLTQFWTRERCLNHVRYRSMICKNNLLLRGPSLSEAEAAACDEIDRADNRAFYARGLRACHVDLPPVRVLGPMLPIVPLGRTSSHHPLGLGHNYR